MGAANESSPQGLERSMFAPPSGVPAALPPTDPASAPVSPSPPATRAGQAARVAFPPWSTLRLPLPRSRHALGRALREALAIELDRGVAFILAPAFVAAGVIVHFRAAVEPALASLAALAVLSGLLAAFASHRQAVRLACTALFLFCVGMMAAGVESWRAATPMLGGEVRTRLTGRIAAVEILPNGRTRLTIDVLATERPTLRYSPERVRVSARKVSEAVQPGAVVTGVVGLLPPTGPVRPGGYDFSFEAWFDGIGASGYFLRGPELAATQPEPRWRDRLAGAVERFRLDVADRVRARIGGAEGEIAAALIVGVRAGIPDDVSEALRRTGIYHIISISGLHMALVAGTIMATMRLAFALAPGFASRRPVKKYAAATALVGIGAYLTVSGAEVAAQRSFLMLAIMLFAVLVDRSAITMRNLAISALLVMIVSPHEVMGPSFQMSFAATAALVGAYAWWGERQTQHAGPPPRRGLPMRMLRWSVGSTAALAATSLVAGSATAAYAAWHFQQMPTIGLVANLVTMPIVSIVVMPAALAAALAMPFGLDGPALDVMGAGLAATIAVAERLAEGAPTGFVGLIPGVSVVLLTMALIVATAATTWLRVVALPLAFAGLASLPQTDRPDVFIAEDGRLVGVVTDEGLAVSRPRPNGFTVENWQRAAARATVLPPLRKAADKGEEKGGKEGEDDLPAGRFLCRDGLCLIRHASGGVVGWAADVEAGRAACGTAALIVVDDATVRDLCPGAVVVTKRDLALRGSAVARLGVFGGSISVDHAVRQLYRPWHEQRRFSRAARGLPEWQRQQPAAPAGSGEGQGRSAPPAP